MAEEERNVGAGDTVFAVGALLFVFFFIVCGRRTVTFGTVASGFFAETPASPRHSESLGLRDALTQLRRPFMV